MSGMAGAESCGPAWVTAGSGPLPEDCDVVIRFLPEHTFPSVMPPAPLSCPDLAPLSFPPVVSGNPVFFSSVPFIRVTLHGENHGFPIKNVGKDNGGSKTSGMTRAESCGPAWVAAGSGPLPEACDVVVRFLPDHTFPSVMPPSPPVLPTGGPFLSAGPPVLPAGC